MLFKVHNSGKGPRHVRTANGRVVVIPPGDEDTAKNVDLRPGDARRLFQFAAKNAKKPSSIQVRALDDEGREILTGKAPAMLADAPGAKPRSPYDEESPSEPASSSEPPARPVSPKETLLNDAPTIGLDELREKTKEILGDDAPKDLARLKRRDIVQLLK